MSGWGMRDVDPELQALARADQEDRRRWESLDDAGRAAVTRRDRERRERVWRRVAAGDFDAAEDFDAVALLLQHGETPDDYETAHDMAVIAGERGRIGSLPALTEDRFLRAVGRLQRFGSQFVYRSGGGVALAPVEGRGPCAVTDALRADFLTPPLAAVRRDGLAATGRGIEGWAARTLRRRDTAWTARRAARPEALRLELAAATPGPRAAAAALAAYRADRLETPADYRNAAAAVLGRRGDDAALLAHELAAVAAMAGDLPARRLYARAWDRLQAILGRARRHGPGGSAPAVVRRWIEAAGEPGAAR